MPIADTWLPYSPKDTYLRAFIVGIANTLRVAVIGIVLATVLGTLVGIARLSANWLLSRLAAVYVEALRDIPLLLQLLFWYVLMQGLPAARQAWKPVEGVFLSNRGLVLPSIPFEPANLWVLLAAAIGIAVTFWYVHRRLTALQIARRQAAPQLAVGAAAHHRHAGAAVAGAGRELEHHASRNCAASISSAG